MSSPLILITGATGHIGFRTLVFALQAKYHVRAAVRSQAKADEVLATESVKKLNTGSNLTFVIVPDILADNAYDEAVKDVDYIIHLASPITGNYKAEEFETKLVQPALAGTTSILVSANKHRNVKRIVITSSVVAVIPWKDMATEESDIVYTEDNEIPFPAGPYAVEFEAYSASKVRALVATREFVKENSPSFDIINVMPSFVVGKNELVKDPKHITDGTNGPVMGPLLGANIPGPMPGTTVFLDDVANVHVWSLDAKIAGNQNFIVHSGGSVWQDSLDVVKKAFPEAVKNGVLPANGSLASKKVLIDASKTERTFGFKFAPYEEQVKDIAGHYLDLVGAPRQ